MNDSKMLFGIHNEEYNLDYYEDGHIEIFNYITKTTITTFSQKDFALFLKFRKRVMKE